VHLSKTGVDFPIVMKTENDDYVKKCVMANIINSDEVIFYMAEKQQKDGR